DAVFLTGSPLHVYADTPEVRRQLAFMRAVFASGTPSFGSCAGLQLAVAAAGGRVRKMPEQMEAGIARRITPTPAGRHQPLLAGDDAAVGRRAALLGALEAEPDSRTVAWELGVDREFADVQRRRTEIANFLRHLVVPRRQAA